jgi:hypothetical protein
MNELTQSRSTLREIIEWYESLPAETRATQKAEPVAITKARDLVAAGAIDMVRNARQLPPLQRQAVLTLAAGAAPFRRSVFARPNADAAAFISLATAGALAHAGLATMTPKWLSLSWRGHQYARELARGGRQPGALQ